MRQGLLRRPSLQGRECKCFERSCSKSWSSKLYRWSLQVTTRQDTSKREHRLHLETKSLQSTHRSTEASLQCRRSSLNRQGTARKRLKLR